MNHSALIYQLSSYCFRRILRKFCEIVDDCGDASDCNNTLSMH